MLNLGALVAIEYIHVPSHIETDGKRQGVDDVFVIADEEDEVEKLRCKITGKLSGKREAELERLNELKGLVAVNTLIWKFLVKVPAENTIRVVPKSFTPDLREFVEKEGSFLEMLGMKKFTKYTFGPDVPGFGIFGQEISFNYSGNGLAIVTQVSKALQQARRLGRFTNMQAAFFPVTPGLEFKSLYENVKKGKETLLGLKSGKNNKPQRFNGDISSKTRATQALLCLADSC